MPSDLRSPEARLARLEACFGRIDERLNAIVEDRREWKSETLRRLEENNDNAKKLMEERARDRAELVSVDLYNSRHQELKTKSESDFRELSQKIDQLSARVDAKMDAHDVADTAHHERVLLRLQGIDEFISNLKGKLWALGVAITAIVTLIQFIIHLLSKT